jgi:6-pyruvoyltetrahydropterin/6-carboxytetrahydropterin synthase
MIEIFKEFSFDAAHHLAPNAHDNHRFARMHGHSFKVKVFLRGAPDAATGWLMSFEDIDKALHTIHDMLDHHVLNEVPGLELPTLENLSRWIWQKLKPQMSLLHRVTVIRGTLGEGCTFEG